MTGADSTTTLVELLGARAADRGPQIAYRFLRTGEGEGESLRYAELHERALAIAELLQRQGLSGKPVLLLCPAGLEYAAALFGCFYAGCIAVPAYPPSRVNAARVVPRVRVIAADAGAQAALVTEEVLGLLEPFSAALPTLLCLPPASTRAGFRPSAFSPDRPAVLQYTSGSTAAPKGVVLTHRQVLANLAMARASGQLDADTTLLSWLPPFHDMGLFGALLLAPYLGSRLVFMPPEAFLRRPVRWLRAATDHRARLIVGPSFAFELCARRIDPRERERLDLSSIQVAYCGSEQVSPDALDRFARAFADHGFRREAFRPCYGLAEATLIVSSGEHGSAPVVRAYDAAALETGRVQRVSADAAPAGSTPRRRRLAGVGGPLLDERILIVDPETRAELPPRHVGEIWVQSSSVASGYWKRPIETIETFGAYTSDTQDGPFLRTGDLGFFDDGELFVTGRIKDLIIVRGRNHYPQDVERTAQSVHPGLLADCGAAFAVEVDGAEELVLLQELDRRPGAAPPLLLGQVLDAIRDEHGLALHDLVLLKRGSLLKTTSGKVQRSAMKRAYQRGELEVLARLHSSAAHDGAAPSPPPTSSVPAPPHTLTQPVAKSRRELAIAAFLCEQIAARCKVAPGEIDRAQSLARYGVDSVMAEELIAELESFLGVPLPSTLSYDYPSIERLARALAQLERPSVPEPQPTPPARRPRQALSADREDPIAIVGMACRFPGAPDLAGFWQLLRNGVDAITELPAERWDAEAIFDPEPGTPGTSYSRWAGVIERIEDFDPQFFGISAREAARMDPQQRLFLELCWEALEDAGQSPAELAGSETGVFAGVCTSDYATRYGGDLQLVDADYGAGSSPGVVPNRVSYFLDLKGPSEAVDSACASSLVALDHGCQSLRGGRCELALVGGVNALLAPETTVCFSQLGALARDGRCKSFDSRADGFVRSEGAGVVVLKRLSRALADRDRIYALVAGTAVNHVGRSNGLLAPNGLAQRAVIERALDEAGIGAAELSYVEAHGVGTPVADAVELTALGALVREHGRRRPLLVGSAKTNVGHLEAASGMVSLIKTALALHHEEIPPHLHLRDPLPGVDLEQLGLEIPTVAAAFPRAQAVRFAGVSSFGFGGTNAHAVLREAPAAATASAEPVSPGAHLLVLSAKTPSALRTLSARMAAMLGRPSRPSLGDVCFTAAVGRAHHRERVAFLVRDHATLITALTGFARGEGPLPELAGAGDAWSERLAELGRLYLAGAGIDWRACYALQHHRKVSLPSHPFERQRYWLDFPERSLLPPAPTVIERPSSHPLISRIRIHSPGRSGFVRREPGDKEGNG